MNAPLGALADTSALTRGASRLSQNDVRFKARVTPEQTRALAKCARKELGLPDIADSWIVARHFCLRYGAELVQLQIAGAHSAVNIQEGADDERATVTITLFHRKLQKSPVTVVRRCICRLQGRALCGACVLRARRSHASVFPQLSYAEGLAYLKVAAIHLKLEKAEQWGTHAFRRGWADEALKAGGVTALFYSGGWRGVAAFSYVAAQSRGAVESAEWLVEYSDSSDGERV